MAQSLLASQLPVDDWVLLPTKLGVVENMHKSRAYGRFIRHILFDIGRGLFTNLSEEHHKLVLDHCRKQYQSYVIGCRKSGRTPMPFRHTDKGYICWWKWQQKGAYVRNDIPKRIAEFQKVA
jgi:hypothetical protein